MAWEWKEESRGMGMYTAWKWKEENSGEVLQGRLLSEENRKWNFRGGYYRCREL